MVAIMQETNLLVIKVFLLVCVAKVNSITSFALRLNRDVEEDLWRNTSELIEKRGYPVEEHQVTTDDGYILGLQRIPSPTKQSIPVLLMHGILETGSDWIINDADQSLGYILHDNGYDVWIGNFRGNTYSRKHVTLSPDKSDFWKFSWDEMGSKDLPALIDHILKESGSQTLHYVGYSLGTTAALALLSERPEYNGKVRLFTALAPVAFATHSTTPFRALSFISTPLKGFLNLVTHGEVLSNGSIAQQQTLRQCMPRYMARSCMRFAFPITGCTPENLNQTRIPLYLSHAPAGTSVNTLLHYQQSLKNSTFKKFDFGHDENLKKYNQSEPPHYDLAAVKVPVAIYWGESDKAAVPTDVALLRDRLQNVVVEFYKVPDPEWKHMDFLYGLTAQKILYPKVLQVMRRY